MHASFRGQDSVAMSDFFINKFHGISPRTAPRKLTGNQSQIARNCDIFSQELRALRSNIQENNPTKDGTKLAIFQLGNLWLHWTTDVDVMRSPLFLENESRIHYTGDYNPKSTDATLAASGIGTNYPNDFYRLGVPRPDTAPTVAITGGVGNAIDRSYVYTFVTAWGEEGPPSPETTFTGLDDATSWDLSNIDATPPNTGGITSATPGATTVAIRLDSSHFLETGEYITIRGSIVGTGDLPTDLIGTHKVIRVDEDDITIELVTNGTYTSGGLWDREAPLQTTDWKKNVYRSIAGTYRYVGETTGTTYTDTTPDEDLAEELPGGIDSNDWWRAPAGNMQGIKALANGVSCGFYDNVLALTPPNVPSAWPRAYEISFEYRIINIGVLGNTVVVATTGEPYVVNVDDPAAAISSKLEFYQPCVSKRSLVEMQNGVLYASPDGLIYVPSAGLPTIITRAFAKKKDWDKFNPSSLLGAVFDDRYYGFYSDGGDDLDENGGIIFDPKEPEATFTQLTGLITAVYTVPETDVMYLMDDDLNAISRFDSGGDFQMYQWLSKTFTTPRMTALQAAKVKLTLEQGLTAAETAEAIAAAVESTENLLSDTEVTVPLGEPAGWDGPYEAFGFDVIHGYDAIAPNGYPFVTERNNNLGVSYYFTTDDPAPAGSPWKQFSGHDKGDGAGTPFVSFPNDTDGTIDAYTVFDAGSGTLAYRIGNIPGNWGRVAIFNPGANTKYTRQADVSLSNYTEVTRSDVTSWTARMAGDGNIYGFFGYAPGLGSGFIRIGQLALAGANAPGWTEMTETLTPPGGTITCGFVVKLSDGRLWIGGGCSQASCTASGLRYETWYYDTSQPDGSRLSSGPALPSSNSEDWRKPAIAPLQNGEVYISTQVGGTKYSYIFESGGTFRSALADLPGTWTAGQSGGGGGGQNLIALPDGRLMFVGGTQQTYISNH